MIIRPVRRDEYDEVGELTVEAYNSLPDAVHESSYDEMLRDVAARVVSDTVLVAVDADDKVLGAVTFVADPRSPYAEFEADDEAGFRMLAVAPKAQGQGAGEALVRACVERARAMGKRRVVIHTTPWMTGAHRLYDRLGFRRAVELDWRPLPEVPLLGYVFDLTV